MTKKSESHEVEVMAPEHELEVVNSAGTAPQFTVVKAVTRPVLKFGAAPEYILIESAMYQGEPMEKSKIKELPILMDVVDLKTGEAMLMICPTVFRQELSKAYPDHTYVGKTFQVRKIKTEDKDYSLWGITEIALK